jgi:hypothetical protein
MKGALAQRTLAREFWDSGGFSHFFLKKVSFFVFWALHQCIGWVL